MFMSDWEKLASVDLQRQNLERQPPPIRMNFRRIKIREHHCRRHMLRRWLSQGIRAMQDPDFGTFRTNPVLNRRLVMHKQIRLQRFNQTEHLRASQVRMDCRAGELEWPACTERQNMSVPTLGFMRTPNVEHTLSPTHGQ